MCSHRQGFAFDDFRYQGEHVAQMVQLMTLACKLTEARLCGKRGDKSHIRIIAVTTVVYLPVNCFIYSGIRLSGTRECASKRPYRMRQYTGGRSLLSVNAQQ
jgi:hypothetical protein